MGPGICFLYAQPGNPVGISIFSGGLSQTKGEKIISLESEIALTDSGKEGAITYNAFIQLKYF